MTIPDRLNPEERAIEQVLRLGYHLALSERFPFNKKLQDCSSPESAYFRAIEMNHMEIPREFYFESLKNLIPEKHRERIEKVWNRVLEIQSKWRTTAQALKNKWSEVPKKSDSDSDSDAELLILETRINLKATLEKTAKAIISIPPVSEELTPLQQWQAEELGLREKFFRLDKNYLTILRLYYELLLERPPEEKGKEPKYLKSRDRDRDDELIIQDKAIRERIAIENRNLRLIDGTHQVLSYTRSTHHEQKEQRVRKFERKPAWFHPLEATGAYILDVVPYVIDKRELPYDFMLGIAAVAMHDLDEDTALQVKDVVDGLKKLADHIDSSVIQIIESGFIVDQEKARTIIKKRMLALFGDDICGKLRRVLRILSDKTNLDQKQEMEARRDFDKLRSTGEFPQLCDTKIVEFLKRLLVLIKRDVGTKSTRRMQQAVIAKMLDRANNLLTIANKDSGDQKDDLHGAFRLIAYAMLDYDQENHPLYNALPRLIDVTVKEYQRFAREHGQNMTSDDHGYLEQLITWQGSVRRYIPPAHVQEILDEYNAAV